MAQLPFSGAVDLAALAAQRQRAAAPPVEGVAAMSEANVADLLELSARVPLFVVFTSAAAPQCADLVSRLRVVLEERRFPLATVDVDVERGLAQAFQVQAVPAVMAVIAGRPAPLFQGSPDDAQLRDVVAQVAQVAAQAGMTLPAPAEGTAEPAPEPELPPLHKEAFEAIEREDFDAALAAYDRALKENPRDADAKAGKAQVGLLARTHTMDPEAALAAAAAPGASLEALLAGADAALLLGDVENALDTLLSALAPAVADDKERIRLRLVEAFEIVGGTEPAVIAARQRLASLLN